MKKSLLKNSVLTSATVVTVLSVLERGLGFLYRIVLSRLIGAEGLGLYQVALSLFSLFLTIGTGGIPITVSRMISKSKAEKNPDDERATVGAGMLLSLLLTLPMCLLLIPFGDNIPFLFADKRAFSVFRILLFGLCFSSLYAVIRGSFWGNKQFLTPSVIELAEESVMVLIGVLLLQNVPSPLTGAEKAAWAVVISYVFSFCTSLFCFFLKGGKLSSPKKQLKPLFKATMPITSVRASGSLVNSAVAVLLPVMLIRAGAESSEALTLFGIVSGMVLPILFIPSTLIGSLALVLVPELSEDFYKDNRERLQKNIERGLLFSFLVACALIPFYYAIGEDLGKLAFSNAQAGEMIVKSCPLLLPMCLSMISTSMLNSMGFEKQTFIFYFIGAAALLLCILFLPSVCGVYAYIVGMGASFVLTALCNLVFLRKKCPIFKKRGRQVCVQVIVPALISILPISLFGKLCDVLLSKVCNEFISLFISAVSMFLCSILFYFITKFFCGKKKLL